MTKSELRQMIRECLKEELSKQSLTEASRSRKAYEALMEIQAMLSDIPGWSDVDMVQDDDYTMNIKYDLADDAYVWYELDNGDYEYTEAVEAVAERCRELGVSLDIYENDSTSFSYDITVYLHYQG